MIKLYCHDDIDSFKTSITFNDIGLVPTRISDVEHRSDVDLTTSFLGKNIELPVLSAPMESVSGVNLCESTNNRILGIVHRVPSNIGDDRTELYYLTEYLKNEKIHAISVGVNVTEQMISVLANIRQDFIICIDTANAQNYNVLRALERINNVREKIADCKIKVIIGNINNGSQLNEIVQFKPDAIRVGIGNGSMCTTSIQTGIGIGQLSAIYDVYSENIYNHKISIIADGGINTPGDIVKALVFGADVVMLGRMLSGTRESPGTVIKHNDRKYKIYRGAASYGAKAHKKFIEGEETLVPYKGSVDSMLNYISDGLKSAVSYLGYSSLNELKEFRSEVNFVRLSTSAYIERTPVGKL